MQQSGVAKADPALYPLAPSQCAFNNQLGIVLGDLAPPATRGFGQMPNQDCRPEADKTTFRNWVSFAPMLHCLVLEQCI